jgi:protein TonB
LEAEENSGRSAGREREKRFPSNVARRSQPMRNRWDWRLAGTAHRASPLALNFPAAEAGSHSLEPCFTSAASLPDFQEAVPPLPGILPDHDPGLPAVSRSTSVAIAMPKGRTRAAIAISAICHAALLLFFVHFAQDTARIAGGEQSGVVILGNADQDQLRSGDASEPNVTHVSLISVSKARPVETATVAPAVVVEAVEPVKAVEAVQPGEAIAPMEEAAAELETTATVAQAVTSDPVLATPPPNDVPPVLATDEATTVATPKAVTANAAGERADAAKPVESASSASLGPAVSVQPVEETQSEQPVETDEIPPLPQRVLERPSHAKREKPVEKHHREASPKAEKRAEREAEALPNGSLGKGSADQRKGRAEGSEGGLKAVASRGRAASAEGDAAVSNYPGKIVRRLRRALRYPAGAGNRRLHGVAQVRFVVSSGGAVGAVRLVASSGSTLLDKAALEAVRRAAPFPPIPAEAGRSSWPFTVPLAFVR